MGKGNGGLLLLGLLCVSACGLSEPVPKTNVYCREALLIFGTFFACVLFNVFVVTGAFALFNPLAGASILTHATHRLCSKTNHVTELAGIGSMSLLIQAFVLP